MTQNLLLMRVIAAALALGAFPAIATAQGSSGTPANQGGPMVIEQVHQRFAIAPEFKVSKFDGATAEFAGAHGGLFLTDTILIGGGVYTLTNGSRGRGMTYGGAVIGWQPWSSGSFGLDVRGLVGIGQGTTTGIVSILDRDGRESLRGTRRFSRDFVVAEPQADVLVKLTRHFHLAVGGGYRFIGESRLDGNSFSGASGSIALRIGSAQ